MGELNRDERLQIMLTQAELRIVDTWRFAKRMPSRAAAIRELLKRGMAAEGFAEVQDGQSSRTSRFCRTNRPNSYPWPQISWGNTRVRFRRMGNRIRSVLSRAIFDR